MDSAWSSRGPGMTQAKRRRPGSSTTGPISILASTATTASPRASRPTRCPMTAGAAAADPCTATGTKARRRATMSSASFSTRSRTSATPTSSSSIPAAPAARASSTPGNRASTGTASGRPRVAVLETATLGLPDAVPVEARFPGVDEALAAGAAGIDEEDVGVALVLERVEKDADDIVARRRALVPVAVHGSAAAAPAVMGHRVGRDARGLAVVAVDANIEIGPVVDDPGLRLFAWVIPGPRLDHAESIDDGRRLPGGVVQAPVDSGPCLDADGLEVLASEREGRGADRDHAQDAYDDALGTAG